MSTREAITSSLMDVDGLMLSYGSYKVELVLLHFSLLVIAKRSSRPASSSLHSKYSSSMPSLLSQKSSWVDIRSGCKVQDLPVTTKHSFGSTPSSRSLQTTSSTYHSSSAQVRVAVNNPKLSVSSLQAITIPVPTTLNQWKLLLH